jgi:hypothetical protein
MSIDKLIELSEKQTKLLKELKESLHYESCTYDVREIPGYDVASMQKKYMIFEIATGKEVTFGYREGSLRWFDLRNIPQHKIHNIQILIK